MNVITCKIINRAFEKAVEMLKSRFYYILFICLVCIFYCTGCGRSLPDEDASSVASVSTEGTSSAELQIGGADNKEESKEASNNDSVKNNDVINTNDDVENGKKDDFENNNTPYQLINLMVGNAESISFEYTVNMHETGEIERGSFYKNGEVSAQIFSTKDMYGNSLVVREVERENRVFYIIDETKKIVSYLAPAEDMLLYEVMEACDTSPVKTSKQDEFFIYEYEMPFEQDDSIVFKYRLYIKDNMLKKLELFMAEKLLETYEFQEFIQEVKDQTVFELPEGYHEDWMYYPYSGEHMPPWWEP